MKRTTSLLFKQIIILLNIIGFCMLPTLLSAQANQKQYKFTNSEDANAEDLHIRFNDAVTFVAPVPNPEGDVTTQVPAGTFPEGNGSGSNTVNLAKGFTGSGVAPGDDIVLTFAFDGAVPQVAAWWWTNDNNLDPRTGRLGQPKRGQRGVFEYASVEPSTGDGLILLTIDGDSNTFEIPPNLSAVEVAEAFQSFVEDQFLFAEALPLEEAKVEIFSRAHSNYVDEILVNITPDSTMDVEFKYIPEVIPTLSQWGVIILILLTLTVGMVFLYVRQTALAIPGGMQVNMPGMKPKLFDKKLYARISVFALLAGVGVLGLLYAYFGEITSADPFGTFVSMAIVVYMVHFVLLNRKNKVANKE